MRLLLKFGFFRYCETLQCGKITFRKSGKCEFCCLHWHLRKEGYLAPLGWKWEFSLPPGVRRGPCYPFRCYPTRWGKSLPARLLVVVGVGPQWECLAGVGQLLSKCFSALLDYFFHGSLAKERVSCIWTHWYFQTVGFCST